MDEMVTKGAETCQCGKPFSTLEAIQGRSADWFRLPGGRELWPGPMAFIVTEHAPWIQQYEFIQEREDRIILRVVSETSPPDQELKSIKSRLQKVLGEGVEFRIDFVPEIIPGPSGKFRIFRSLVR
jgi:phenylacetate-coenzyme A ligase PaaK-like adenylate-forming protein